MDMDRADQTRKGLIAGKPVAFLASTPPDERTVPADWLIEAVGRGVDVSLENAHVVGRLDLHDVHVRGDVRILSSKFVDFMDLSYAVFDLTLRLEGCNFEQGACFDSVRLRSDVVLDESTFGANRDPCLEKRTNLFNDAEIVGVLSANSVTFAGGTAWFERVRFGSSAFFCKARFECAVDFSEIDVNGDLAMDQAVFVRPCNLTAARVTGKMTLSDARFARRAQISLFEAEVGRGVALSRGVFLGAFTAPRARFGSIDPTRRVRSNELTATAR
jgi:hypothetical protein